MNKVKNDLDLRRFMRDVKKFWWLYALAFVVFMGAAITYASMRMSVYESHSTILIEDSSDPTAAAMAVAKSSAAAQLFSLGSSKTTNELIVLSSYDVFSRSIAKAGLNINYIERQGLGKRLLFPNPPFRVDVPQNVLDTLTGGFKIDMKMNGARADIEIKGGFMGMKTLAKAENTSLPVTLKTPYCPVTITGSPRLAPDGVYTVSVTGTPKVIESFSSKLSTEVRDKTSDAISLTFEDPTRERGVYFLNTLMDEYNNKRLSRRRENAANEVAYCNDRLQILLAQLSDSEEKVERFKRDNNILRFELDSAGWMAHVVAAKDKIAQSQNELTYYDQVLFTVQGDKAHNSLLPASMSGGLPNPLVEEYNKAVLEKRELERSATPDNPKMKVLNEHLDKMRSSLISEFSQMVQLNRNNLGSIYSLSSEAEQKLRQVPGVERELFNLLRDKTIKNELYLYLLQRREAAELRLSSTDMSGFIVEKAYSDTKPSMKKSIIAVLAALLLSLILPSLFVLMYMKWRNVVRNSMDLANIGIEKNALESDEPERSMRQLRTIITDRPDKRVIYVADFSKAHPGYTAEELANTMRAVDMDVALVSCSSEARCNDEILSATARENVSGNVSRGKYVIVEIPAPSELDEIMPLLREPDAELLVAVDRGKMSRKRLHSLLKGLNADDVFTYILGHKD